MARLQMAFKTPLQSGDAFISRLALKKEGIRYLFIQDIYRKCDEKLVLKAVVDAVCRVNGRLGVSERFDKAFTPFLDDEQ